MPLRRTSRNVSRVSLAEPTLEIGEEDESAISESEASAGGSEAEEEDSQGGGSWDAEQSDDEFEDKPSE